MNSAIPSFLFICWPLFSFAEYDSERNLRHGNDLVNLANSSEDGWYPENVDSDENVRSNNASDNTKHDFKNVIPSEHFRNGPIVRYNANGNVYTWPSYPVRQLIRVESRPVVGQPLKPYPVVYKTVPYEVRVPYKKRLIFEKRVPVPVHPFRIVAHPVQVAALHPDLKVPAFSHPQFTKPSLFDYENDARTNRPAVSNKYPVQNNQNFSISSYQKLPVNKPVLNNPEYNGSRQPPQQGNYQELLLRPLQETAALYLPQMNDIFDRSPSVTRSSHQPPNDTRFPPRNDLSAQQSSATPSLPSPSTEETPQLPIEEYFKLNKNATFDDQPKPDVSNYNLHEFSIDNPNALNHVHNLTEFHVGSTKHYSSPFDLLKSFKFKYKLKFDPSNKIKPNESVAESYVEKNFHGSSYANRIVH